MASNETGRYWLDDAASTHAVTGTGTGAAGASAAGGPANSTVSIALSSRSGSNNSQNTQGSDSRQFQQHGTSDSSYAPPPRRTGASLPLPHHHSSSSSASLDDIGGRVASSSFALPPLPLPFPSSSSSSSPSSLSRTRSRSSSPFRARLEAFRAHFIHFLHSFLNVLHAIHPVSWRASAHLTDQASAALLCYKLYALSITVPPSSKIYFYYLPSCVLSDLVAILLLQLGHWLAFERCKNAVSFSASSSSSSNTSSAGTPAMAYSTTFGSPTSVTTTSESGASKLAASRYLPRRVQDLLQRVLPRGHTYYSPLEQEGDSTSPITAFSAAGTNTTTSNDSNGGLMSNMRRAGSRPGRNEEVEGANDEERASFLNWKEEEEGQGDIDAEKAAGFDNVTNEQKKEEAAEQRLEHASLAGAVTGSQRVSGRETQSPSAVLYNELASRFSGAVPGAGVGGARSSASSKCKILARALFWVVFRFSLIVACLTAIVFTVIAIGAYSAGRVVFSWQGAFDSTSQSGYLFGYAMTEFGHFLLAYITILALGTSITLSRYWVPHYLEGASLSRFIPAGKKRIALIAVATVCFLAICAAVRPPHTLPATDLLIDGITATSAILFFSNGHTHPLGMDRNSTIYGQSNAFQPRITTIDSKKIEHVFFVFLESADELAWPYSPEFCEHRNCKDIPDEYNNVEHFTPFFNKLITEDPHTVFIEDFRTNLAYTIKAHLASMCGVMPHIHDYMSSEAEMIAPTACLPHIVKKLDDRFTTGWFQAQMTAYDRQHEVISLEGFETIYDSNTLTAKFGRKKEWTNYFGYSDEELHPFIWDWVDQKLNKSQRIFMATAGATMHHPFTVPPWVPKIEYTKTEWSNNYLNVVKRTDEDLEKFFDNLKARDLLDKSLIIMQGDHGPRIGEDGVYVDFGWWERIYKSPLAIRAPGLDPKRIRQDPAKPYVALDIMPTILDALGVPPSIMKSFVGQSIFRNRRGRHYVRDTFHAQSRGGQYPHTLRVTPSNQYKAVKWDTGDICATDLNVDPTETYFYCVNDGWRQVFGGKDLADGISQGLWKSGSQEEEELISYAIEAKGLLEEHLRINADFWDVGQHKQEYDDKRRHFLETVSEAAHWH